MNDKKLYDVSEFQRICPMSVAGIYKAMAEKKIPCVSVGRRKFIPSWFVNQLINKPVTQ